MQFFDPKNPNERKKMIAAAALALVGAGQFTLGTVVSFTVNVVVQVALLPASSVAVTVMMCAPNPTSAPAAGN